MDRRRAWSAASSNATMWTSILPGGSDGSDGWGGGVYLQDGVLDRCVIRNNSATTPGLRGRGDDLEMDGWDLNWAQNCLIYSNSPTP